MTGGIILLVMVPILLFMAIIWFCCFKKRKDKDTPAWTFDSLEPRSRSNSRANLKSGSMGNLTDSYKKDPYQSPYSRQESEPYLLRQDSQPIEKSTPIEPANADIENEAKLFKSPSPENSMEPAKESTSPVYSTPKKRRSYDSTYRTHEPLEGHPNSEFPEKMFDLNEEDVLSSGSNDGSDLTNTTITKPADDISYISGTKPKQYGRRGQNKPIDSGSKDEPLYVDYNSKYDDQESTFSSQYSPTGSDAYSPSTSPIYGVEPPKTYFPVMMPVPEEPRTVSNPKLSTFSAPVKKGKSTDALQNQQDPLAPGELRTFSSRTTMV